MKKHEDYITHINNEKDLVYLKTKHFPVNIRLFKTSEQYKNIILQQCNYIRELCLDIKEGYKKPHGMSSANAGLSFNIIGITMNRNKPNEYCNIMINPKIIHKSQSKIISFSNCGSITLEKPIQLERYSNIRVEWFDENGEYQNDWFNREQGCLTIQHEIDHNLGILITDY
jgi:peptide deformylase